MADERGVKRIGLLMGSVCDILFQKGVQSFLGDYYFEFLLHDSLDFSDIGNKLVTNYYIIVAGSGVDA